MKRKQARFLLGLAVGIAFMLITAWNLDNTHEATGEKISPSSQTAELDGASKASSTYGNATVVRVVDGDTFEVRLDSKPEQEIKIRMLGINTPETVDPRRPVECYGKEASDFVKNLLEGCRVHLAADPEADEIDKYGRLLRNVFLADGTDVNAKLVGEGYAYAYVSFPQNEARKAELRALEAEARENFRGLWNPETCNK